MLSLRYILCAIFVLGAVGIRPVKEPHQYYQHWCDAASGALQYLDDASCAKVFPGIQLAMSTFAKYRQHVHRRFHRVQAMAHRPIVTGCVRCPFWQMRRICHLGMYPTRWTWPLFPSTRPAYCRLSTQRMVHSHMSDLLLDLDSSIGVLLSCNSW